MTIWEAEIGFRRVVQTPGNTIEKISAAAEQEFQRLTGTDSDFLFCKVGDLDPIQRKIQHIGNEPITVFEIKIGVEDNVKLPDGADLPMRLAVGAAFAKVTGFGQDYLYSGWGASLTPDELNRLESK
jgi:hypothetical protein